MTTSRRRWLTVAIGLIAIATAGAALVYPRLARCYFYHRLVSIGDATSNLAPRPHAITLEPPPEATPLSMGYARTAFPPDWITGIDVESTIVVVQREGESVVFWTPHYDTTFSSDGNYSWTLATTRARRLSLGEVFAMSREHFEQLIGLTLPKAVNTNNQNGIGHFESDEIRGIIRLGPRDRPGHMSIEVWSKRGRIAQEIIIDCRSEKDALEIAHCVLTSLRYTFEDVPEERTLQSAIRDSLHDHPLASSPR